MGIRLKYETKAGNFSEPETFMQIIEYLRLVQEACAAMGHHKKLNDEEMLGQGWLAVSQMMELTARNVTQLATKGIIH